MSVHSFVVRILSKDGKYVAHANIIGAAKIAVFIREKAPGNKQQYMIRIFNNTTGYTRYLGAKWDSNVEEAYKEYETFYSGR